LGKVYCLVGISIIPLVIVYLILSRFIIKGVTAGAVKG
jgi:multiple sugar transport system permease protein